MIATVTTYDLLASLVAYPQVGYASRLEECARKLAEEHPQAGTFLQPFLEHARGLTVEDLEELYTRTFDINPVCCLEVGWQLFGEEYERGSFLVKMRKMLREANLAESTELPDHLVHVLALLGQLDRDGADELAASAVLPALKKMLDGLAGKDNPYENVLKAIESVLWERHARPSEGESDD